MELTKEQIQNIDKRLQKNGLAYWDIRIEILDHLVSEIENKLSKGEPYNSAIENAFYKLNLNGNLESLNKSRLVGINKIVRKQYFSKVQHLLTNSKALLLIIVFILTYYFIYSDTNLLVYKITTGLLLFSPLAFGVIFHFKEYTKKKKSGYLIYSTFYVFFAFMMLNVFLQFFQPNGLISVSKEVQRTIWFAVTCVNGVFSYAGLSIYFETRNKILGIENKIKLQ